MRRHPPRRAGNVRDPLTLSAILQLRRARRAGAVDAAKDASIRFNTVTDDTAVAVRANRRQRVDRALEAIEGVTFSANDNFKRLVIVVLANFTCSHTEFLRARWGSRRCIFSVANGIQQPNRRLYRCRLQSYAPNFGPGDECAEFVRRRAATARTRRE